MPEYRSRKISVELEFDVTGSESDGTAIDLIIAQLASMSEKKLPRSDKRPDGRSYEGEIGLTVRRPELKSITMVPR